MFLLFFAFLSVYSDPTPVYVGNLNTNPYSGYQVTSHDLETLFGQYGKVVSVELSRHRAIVYMDRSWDAMRATVALQGTNIGSDKMEVICEECHSIHGEHKDFRSRPSPHLQKQNSLYTPNPSLQRPMGYRQENTQYKPMGYYQSSKSSDIVGNPGLDYTRPLRHETGGYSGYLTAVTASGPAATENVVVYAFATIGLGFLLYGAGKHFFTKTNSYTSIQTAAAEV